MQALTKTCTYWVCVDCDDKLHSTPAMKFSPGLFCESSKTDLEHVYTDEHSEKCSRQDFSKQPCDNCGSHLAGYRLAWTKWEING